MAILIRYDVGPMLFFGDGEWSQPVDLYIEKKTWFGWSSKVVKQKYTITMFQDLKQHYDYWDGLIIDKLPVQL